MVSMILPTKELIEELSIPEPNTGCWLSIKLHPTTGYGRVWFAGKDWRAHRASWVAHFGDPGNLRVLHKCDTPACVNPEHLFLGTDADNVSDKCGKLRQARGSRQGHAKLSEDDVRRIKTMFSSRGNAAIAREYGVTKEAIRYIRIGQNWRHID